MKRFKKEQGLNDKNRSIVGCLLSEISWEGSKTSRYRNGGLGLENVLTTEVFQMLYLLPRTQFLGSIIKQFHTKNKKAVDLLYKEVENVNFNQFPGNYYLIDEPQSHQSGIAVQPDSLIISDSVYSLIEVKRIKRSSFQYEQLAREFYLVTREAKNKIPLLVLIINKKPPVSVKGQGRVDPVMFIKNTLPKVYSEADSHNIELNSLIDMVDNHVAWITWEEIYNIIEENKHKMSIKNKSVKESINRLCDVILDAINRHS